VERLKILSLKLFFIDKPRAFLQGDQQLTDINLFKENQLTFSKDNSWGFVLDLVHLIKLLRFFNSYTNDLNTVFPEESVNHSVTD
jgi:hypothetical protein